jgi:glycosyltransferase involved in cell wall biosynthesis
LPKPSVSVVIPAFNAATTLAATLDTVRSQSLASLEVIVVDDGSTDATAAVAARYAREDRRIRCITIPNGGVASARNVGIEAARAPYIAPLDADDLWHPHKTARQLAVLTARPEVSMVYCSRRNIDARGLVLRTIPKATLSGWACHRLTTFNAVGNGSAIMFRTAEVLKVGGYDIRLRQRGAQGCEDYLLQVRLAAIGEVVADGDYLVGYRKTANAMSTDDIAMLRSRLFALEIIAEELPELAATAHFTYKRYQFLLARKDLAAGRTRSGLERMGGWICGLSPKTLRDSATYLADRRRGRKRLMIAEEARRPYADYRSDEAPESGMSPYLERALADLKPLDLAYGNARSVTKG